MEEALTAVLLAAAPVTALVDQAITWGARPQGDPLPAVVLYRIDGQPDYTNDGPSGLASSRVQIDCWGATYAAAKGVARAVEATLSGIDTTQDGVALRGGFVETIRDDRERGKGGEDLYRTRIDLILWHKPT